MIWGTEYWVLSGYPERLSVVADGPCASMGIDALIAREGAALLGEGPLRRFGGEFPLLVKFIDAREDLSIQVHPDEETAMRVHGTHGKTEMWYILSAKPQAHIYAGLSRAVTPEEYEALVDAHRITEVLADHRIAPGDVFFLPPGRIHAICGGTFLAEIQQTSDLTYRIYDYGRKGTDGKMRVLHTDWAKDAIDYQVYPSYRTEYTRRQDTEVPLVSCAYFRTSLYDLTRPLRCSYAGLDSFVIVVCVAGSGTVSAGGDTQPLSMGECLLLPATATAAEYRPGGEPFRLLVSHL